MKLTDNKTIRILSAALIGVLLIVSGRIGWINRGKHARFIEHTDPVVSDTSLIEVSASDTTEETEILSMEPVEENVHLRLVTVKNPTAIRSEDNTASEKIAVINKKIEVECVSESDSYYMVKYAGSRIGWIHKSCCDYSEKDATVKYAPKNPASAFDLSQTKESHDLDAILKNYGTMGASIAVIKDGKVAYHYEYGYANRENNVKVAENTKFRVASVSKVFTAMLAMSEVDDGRLDLDRDISEIMGYQFRNPSYSTTKITTRMLLTHSAGYRDKSNMFSKALIQISNSRDYYSSRPGTKFYYSNLSIGIAGAVVEKSADQTISQYARDRFFAPMGIDASFDAKYLSDQSLVADCYSGKKINHSSSFLTRSQEKGKPGDVFHLGQGGLLISSEDLAAVLTILINDGQYNGRQYLSQEAVMQMLSKQNVDTKSDFDQCIGIRKYSNLVSGHDLYYHNGDSYGIYSLIAIDPSDKSGVAVITSGAYAKRNSNTVFDVCDDLLNYTYSEIL